MARLTDSKALSRSISDEVLHGRPPDYLKVFISSKMHGGALKPERSAAIGTVDSLPGYRAWAWEKSALPGPYSAVRVCEREAGTSDEIILIVDDELTRVTQREYRAARRGGAARFVFIKDRSPRPSEVERFVARERNRKTVTGTFRNVPELRSLIRNSLRAYSIYAIREAVIRERRQT
jgi:hypothetical protein